MAAAQAPVTDSPARVATVVSSDNRAEGTTLARIFGFLALVMASINIFGGFLVTSRMLAMYKKKDKTGK